jgi:hypothetical protein
MISSYLFVIQDNLGTMREAAESAETDLFDPKIAASSGATGTLVRGYVPSRRLTLFDSRRTTSRQDPEQGPKAHRRGPANQDQGTPHPSVLCIPFIPGQIAQATAAGSDTSSLESSLTTEQYVHSRSFPRVLL